MSARSYQRRLSVDRVTMSDSCRARSLEQSSAPYADQPHRLSQAEHTALVVARENVQVSVQDVVRSLRGTAAYHPRNHYSAQSTHIGRYLGTLNAFPNAPQALHNSDASDSPLLIDRLPWTLVLRRRSSRLTVPSLRRRASLSSSVVVHRYLLRRAAVHLSLHVWSLLDRLMGVADVTMDLVPGFETEGNEWHETHSEPLPVR